MFLALNPLRPAGFFVSCDSNNSYTLRVSTPLTPKQIFDTLCFCGVSVNLVDGPVEELENGRVLKVGDNLSAEALPNGATSILVVKSPVSPTFSVVGGLSVVW